MLAVVVLCLGLAQSAPYAYEGSRLELRATPFDAGDPVELAWRALGTRTFERANVVAAEDGGVTVEVSMAGGHEVILRKDTKQSRFITTRGTWYALPRANRWSEKRATTARGRRLTSAEDIVLGGAYDARITKIRTEALPEVGRTLTMTMAEGVPTSTAGALVLIGSSTQQGVLVTVTEPRSDRTVRYWDLPLNMSRRTRRYVLPLSAFASRDGREAKPERAGAITVTGTSRAKLDDRVRLDVIALRERAPRISSIRRTKDGIEVNVAGVDFERPPTIHFRAGRRTVSSPVERSTVRANPTDATDAWMCGTDESGRAWCDPADAPITTHPIPGGTSNALAIDDFKGSTWLNAHRLPTRVFTSTIGFAAHRFASRRPSRLRLQDPDVHALEYVGYVSPAPASWPARFTKLRFVVRGKGDPSKVLIGVRGTDGHEPKVPLGTRLDGQWRSVVVPLERFGMGQRKEAVTLTVMSDPKSRQWLDVRLISLIP